MDDKGEEERSGLEEEFRRPPGGPAIVLASVARWRFSSDPFRDKPWPGDGFSGEAGPAVGLL